MPIYEYECRACQHQFELLVLKDTTPVCPECESGDLEQLISGFAVSSESIRRNNVQTARRQLAASKDYRDKKVAEADEIRDHAPPQEPKPKKKA